MTDRKWWQWVLVLWVIVSGAAASSGVIAAEPWARCIAGVNSGILAWGLIKPPGGTSSEKTPDTSGGVAPRV